MGGYTDVRQRWSRQGTGGGPGPRRPGGRLGQAPLPPHYLPRHCLEHYSCLAYISFFSYPFLCRYALAGSNTNVMLRQEHLRTETSGVDADAKREADLRWGHVSCSAPSLRFRQRHAARMAADRTE